MRPPIPRSEPQASGESQSLRPDPDFAALRAFWDGAAAGELRIPRCTQCATWVWYPRDACPHCKGALAWTRTSGRGTLYSFTVVRRALWAPYAPFVPYATGLIALEEDPSVRIVTRFVDCDVDSLQIDMPMRVVFHPLSYPLEVAEEISAPFFTVDRARAGTGGSEDGPASTEGARSEPQASEVPSSSGGRRTPLSRSAPPPSPKEQLR